MLEQALQFQFIKDPPSKLTNILKKPLKQTVNIKTYFHNEYENSPYKFRRRKESLTTDKMTNNITINFNILSPYFSVESNIDYYENSLTIRSSIKSHSSTPKKKQSISPLRNVYLGNSLVSKRIFNGYIKSPRSPDPYYLRKGQKKTKEKFKVQQTSDIMYRASSLLKKYAY